MDSKLINLCKCIRTWNPFKSVKKTSPDFTPELTRIAISLLFIAFEVRSMSFSIMSPVPSTPGLLWRQTTCLIQASVTVTQDLRRPSIILIGCFVSSFLFPGPSEMRKIVNKFVNIMWHCHCPQESRMAFREI